MMKCYNDIDAQEEWERDRAIDLKIIWQCPNCSYHYESERYVNEGLKCPECHSKTYEVGYSHEA